MPTTAALLTFVPITIVATFVPGPTITYVITRSLEGGRLAGLTAGLGTSTGALVHALAACAGLATLLASTPWAFTAIQLVGAAYLVHLGIRQLRSTRTHCLNSSLLPAPARRVRVFIDGTVVDILNPKTALFFVAVLPQFIEPARGMPGTQLMVLALCYVPIVLVVNTTYALLAARVSAGLGDAPSTRAKINRGTGFVYFGVAAFAVLA